MPRRCLPYLVFTLLFLCDYVAGAAKWDVKDTHDRLDRIYKKLGIEHRPKSKGCGWESSDAQEKKEEKKEGCGCEKQASREPVRVSPMRTPAWLGYLLVGVILAAMLVPLVILLVRGGFSEEASSPPAEEEDDEEAEEAGVQRGPWRVDLTHCRELLREGKLAEAFAALHRMTLLALERGQHLTLDEATTNWEYVRRLVSKPSLKQMLGAVTLAAEQSVLGKRPPGVDHYESLERRVLGEVEG